MIDTLTDNAAEGFLKDVFDHLPEWIGCDMENMENANWYRCEKIHITDVLSEYISGCFEGVMKNVEFMLASRLQPGGNFTDYVKNRMMPALGIFGNNNQYPMNRTNQIVEDPSKELVVVLVPADCRTLYETIKNDIETVRNNTIIPQSHTDVISVIKSKNCRRILMIRITAGGMMRADGYPGELEAAYDRQLENPSVCIGRHLVPGWNI